MTTYSQPGVYNVLDYGIEPNQPSAAVTNSMMLQELVYLAQGWVSSCPNSDYGAIILFPGNDAVPLETSPVSVGDGAVYYFAVPVDQEYAVEITCNWPLAFIGTGNVRIHVPDNTESGLNGNLFNIDVESSNDNDLGGITFQDLRIEYPTSPGFLPSQLPPTAIYVTNGQNIRIFRCVFDDCPIAVWFANCQQASILESTITFSNNTGIAVQIGDDISGDQAKEVYIAGNVFRAPGTGSTGLVIQGSEHVRVVDTRIESFYEGIQIVPGPNASGANALRHSFTNVSVYAGNLGDSSKIVGTALTIAPQGNVNVAQIVFSGCEFEPGESSTGSVGAGIILDQGIGLIETVRFVSCYSTRWSGPGIEINSGQHIEILGGMYSGNASGGSPPSAPGGISIYGPAKSVRIVGANCVGKYKYVTIGVNQAPDSPLQDVGIYVDGGASDVIISGCDLRNNAEYGLWINGEADAVTTNVFVSDCDISGYASFADAVLVTGEVSNIQVTSCAGYNDQGPLLVGFSVPGLVTIKNYEWGYFGPVEFYVQQGASTITAITIDGHATHLTSGSFYLAPGESGAVSWTPPTSSINLAVIGK